MAVASHFLPRWTLSSPCVVGTGSSAPGDPWSDRRRAAIAGIAYSPFQLPAEAKSRAAASRRVGGFTHSGRYVDLDSVPGTGCGIDGMSPHPYEKSVATVQRLENGAMAAAIVIAVVAAGGPWWWLAAAFLVFDLSALGYAGGPRLGARLYNAVHNYTAPAIGMVIYVGFLLDGQDLPWLALGAACWAFHVAVDRALGYGLKLHNFAHTHLGRIGRRPTAQP